MRRSISFCLSIVLSIMFSANAAAITLTQQFGATGIVTYDLPPYTQTTNVKVPYSWLLANCPDVVDEYEAYETAAKATAANGRKVWECYSLGLDPKDPLDDFRITRFWMDGNMPKFEFNHTTDGSGSRPVPARTYSRRRRGPRRDGGNGQAPGIRSPCPAEHTDS